MIYELRIYQIHPGQMERFHKRTSRVAVELFRKYHMKIVDFWEDAEGKDTICYIIKHQDMDARNRNFESFRNDPEWIKAKKESEASEPIVDKIENFFMTRVPYSPAQ
jgi:hypothetical protein